MHLRFPSFVLNYVINSHIKLHGSKVIKKDLNDTGRDLLGRNCASSTERWEGQQGRIIKGHEKTIVGDGHAHYLHQNDGFMGVHIRQNLS